MKNLKDKYRDAIVSVAYHNGDDLNTTDSLARFQQCNVGYTPTILVDGAEVENYAEINIDAAIVSRMQVESPLAISISITNSSHADITIENLTQNSITGQFYGILKAKEMEAMDGEIYHFVCRSLLPVTAGETLTIGPNASVTRAFDFIIEPSLAAENCRMVALVQ